MWFNEKKGWDFRKKNFSNSPSDFPRWFSSSNRCRHKKLATNQWIEKARRKAKVVFSFFFQIFVKLFLAEFLPLLCSDNVFHWNFRESMRNICSNGESVFRWMIVRKHKKNDSIYAVAIPVWLARLFNLTLCLHEKMVNKL